jgi:hypothetical protein
MGIFAVIQLKVCYRPASQLKRKEENKMLKAIILPVNLYKRVNRLSL